MEVLNPLTSNTFEFFSKSSSFPSIHLHRKTPNISQVKPSKFRKPVYLSLPATRNFRISARFGQARARRNSLRKKFVDDPKVRGSPVSPEPQNSAGTVSSEKDVSNVTFSQGAFSDVKKNDNLLGVDSAEDSNQRPKALGESVLWNKLENWVEQYREDMEYWGIGSTPIFTIFKDSDGKVKRVTVDEDEILRRSKVEEDATKVRNKILRAKCLAKEMESGKNVIPGNSTVAKFVAVGKESDFVNVIRSDVPQPEFYPTLKIAGSIVLCGFLVVWSVKKLFKFGGKEVQYTELEKEMMRRKIKSRKEKETMKKGSVEVVQETSEAPVIFTERPKLDKQELMNNILKVKSSSSVLALPDLSTPPTTVTMNFDNRVQEIREMARKARETEAREHSLVGTDGEGKGYLDNEFPNELDAVKQDSKKGVINRNGDSVQPVANGVTNIVFSSGSGTGEVAFGETQDVHISNASSLENLNDREHGATDSKACESERSSAKVRDNVESFNTPDGVPFDSNGSRATKKLRVIRSVKEAREYLSSKHSKTEPDDEADVKSFQENGSVFGFSDDRGPDSREREVFDTAVSGGMLDFKANAPAGSSLNGKISIPITNDDLPSFRGHSIGNVQEDPIYINGDNSNERKPHIQEENWVEENFQEVEPIAEKIRVGFRDNYKIAREKMKQQLDADNDVEQLNLAEDDSEFEWMKDDNLREIVFQVRGNELAGRNPFYLMDAEDKHAFFRGLEKKVEKVNDEMLRLHEWLHTNIENLDYGADGISLYDPPEKIIPRWKEPPVEHDPEFLNHFIGERKAVFGAISTYSDHKRNESTQPTESSSTGSIASPLTSHDLEKEFHQRDPLNSKTIIEGSDGSVKAGKKSGKEYWQHTKKWSQGFLECYNAEEDPEVKSIMKDMGKDLDRWVTEKEIQEAAELMDKLPERNKQFIEKKLNKIKREMEMFGPQAVVSKYQEYAEVNEEDDLWWLDLPHVLCIELYTIDDGEQRVGFYSLEMAPDLEISPKPHHVIAFEDAGDCKNLCYIIQAHMEMLGKGLAFVVPRPPKDAFRDAKANGFGVTVIRKGELQLNVDRALEEVEEQIIEIGSKIYQDKIMRERSVDISSLMKGVFGFSNRRTNRRKSERALQKPSKKRS